MSAWSGSPVKKIGRTLGVARTGPPRLASCGSGAWDAAANVPPVLPPVAEPPPAPATPPASAALPPAPADPLAPLAPSTPTRTQKFDRQVRPWSQVALG